MKFRAACLGLAKESAVKFPFPSQKNDDNRF